jgi:choline transporter-like protein 2/4/5
MFEANGQDDDDDEDDGGCCHTKKPWPENPNAPWNKGKCKDVYCIGIFGLFWVGMIAIAVAAFTMGSYHRVIYAMDFNGQSCGTTKGGDGVDSTCPTDSPCDEDLSNKKVITWPRMGTDMVVSIATGFDTTDVQGSIENLNLYGICVEDCPQAGDYICNYEGEKTFLPNKVGASATAAQKKTGVYDCYAEMWSSGVGDVAGIPGMGILSDALMSSACKDVVANCWINPIDTKRMLYRCIPKFWSVKNTGKECVLPESAGNTSAGVPVTAVSPDNPACITYKQTGTDVVDIPKGAEVIFDIMAGIAGRVMRSMSDVTYSWYVIAICGFGVSFALSWGWVIFLQYFVSFVVWSTVVVFYVAWVVVTIVLYMKAGILTLDNIEWLANYLAELLAGHIPSAGGIANLVATSTNTSSDPTPDLLGVSETYELYFQVRAISFVCLLYLLLWCAHISLLFSLLSPRSPRSSSPGRGSSSSSSASRCTRRSRWRSQSFAKRRKLCRPFPPSSSFPSGPSASSSSSQRTGQSSCCSSSPRARSAHRTSAGSVMRPPDCRATCLRSKSSSPTTSPLT